MNNNKSKHRVLKLFLDTRLNYVEEYHDIRESLLTIDQIVKKENLTFDVAKVVIASLLANEEIKYVNIDPDYDAGGYFITNNGVYAYEDEKYRRVSKERVRASWSFYISIASILLSVLAIYLSVSQESKNEEKKQNISTQKSQSTIKSIPEIKLIDSSKIKK